MSKKNVIVSNVSEGHDNPIAELVQVACQFDSDIMLESDNRRINAKSIMGIMAFNPSDGMSVDIVTEGADEETKKLKAVARLLIRKLAEASAIRAPQADSIAQEIAASRYPYIIVCGDFNDTPISYAHRVIEKGLNDAFTKSGRGLGISYNQNKFYFRIDNILASKNLKPYNCTDGPFYKRIRPLSNLVLSEEKRLKTNQ